MVRTEQINILQHKMQDKDDTNMNKKNEINFHGKIFMRE